MQKIKIILGAVLLIAVLTVQTQAGAISTLAATISLGRPLAPDEEAFYTPNSLIIAKGVSRQKVTLAWDRSVDPQVVAYKVYYSYPGSTPKVASLGNVTTTTVSGLTKGRQYTFEARALDSNGRESGPSNTVQYIPR